MEEDRCGAVEPGVMDAWVCNRYRGHEGDHGVVGPDQEGFAARWSTAGPVELKAEVFAVAGRRVCIYVPVDQHVAGKGYVPSVVTEGEAGHSPLVGQGELSEPWYWGHDHAEAQRIADDYNATLGLTPEDVSEIMTSSVAASLRGDHRRQELHRKLGRDR